MLLLLLLSLYYTINKNKYLSYNKFRCSIDLFYCLFNENFGDSFQRKSNPRILFDNSSHFDTNIKHNYHKS